jgi:hypothetical protein
MKRYVSLIMILTTACGSKIPPSQRQPSTTTVARIERKLAKDPCTSALAGLTRSYAYPWRGGAVDDRTIFVTLRAARAKTPVIIVPPVHRESRLADAQGWGIYDVRNDRLTLSWCPSSA